MNRVKIRAAVLFSATLMVLILSWQSNSRAGTLPVGDFRLLDPIKRAMSIIQEEYVDPETVKSNETLIHGAIEGMVRSLNDPYSRFLDPEAYREMKIETDGSFGGLGIVITVRDGRVVIISPIAGSPAFRAGIKAGDTIIEIEGKRLHDVTLYEAIKLLRGPEGATLKMAIEREGSKALMEFSITRENIKIESVAHEKDGKFGCIKISQFIDTTAADVEGAVRELEKGGLSGLVIDLRNNPGGLLDGAIKVSDLFLDSGIIVSVQGREREKVEYTATPGGWTSWPIVILVNRGSASASEIVAGALKDNGRGMLMGEKSYGKGCVQSVVGISNDAALAITTAWYFTPSGHCIHEKGLDPDIVLSEQAEEDEKTQEKKPIGTGSPSNADDPADSVSDRVIVPGDRPMERALDLLKALSLFKTAPGQPTPGAGVYGTIAKPINEDPAESAGSRK